MEFYLELVVILLAFIAGALVWIGHILRRVLMPTSKQRLAMIGDRTDFNLALLEGMNRSQLESFVYSKAALGSFMEELGDDEGKPFEESKAKSRAETKHREQSAWVRMRSWFRGNKDMLIKELIGKVNSIAKSAIGIGGSGASKGG